MSQTKKPKMSPKETATMNTDLLLYHACLHSNKPQPYSWQKVRGNGGFHKLLPRESIMYRTGQYGRYIPYRQANRYI